MIQELYGNYMLEEKLWDPNYDITLKIDGGNLPKTQKVKKTMTEEEQEKVRDSNELVRNERKTIVQPIAELISKFKMNFVSAPIRKAM